jgi:hypothetical protein
MRIFEGWKGRVGYLKYYRGLETRVWAKIEQRKGGKVMGREWYGEILQGLWQECSTMI